MRPIKKLAIANRGEIACRVIRTAKELGLTTVALFSEADRTALHVRKADEAYCVGPAPSRESYLDIDRVIGALRASGAEAVHPGYGFLSENPEFARACERAGVVLVGPPAEAMVAMGEKTRARALMAAAGVPVVPGSDGPVATEEEAISIAMRIGLPVMIKAAAGGGGKGMRKVEREQELASAYRTASSEAKSTFGDGRVYIEKFLDQPRHIEFQVFADTQGNTIHLNERECSVQRRHQKVIEETPSCLLDPELRARMGAVAVKAARAVGYVGAGTVEFLMDGARNFYFLEMNTRLQVEHPVTEWVTGIDLVRWQLEVAEGKTLPQWATAAPIAPRGHAIEARIYAEDPESNFLPSPGRINRFRVPGGPGVRDDSGVCDGSDVPMFYDPMIGKLSVWAERREMAIARLDRALSEYLVEGVATNIAWLRRVLLHPEFTSGRYDTGFLARRAQELRAGRDARVEEAALAAAALLSREQAARRGAVSPAAETQRALSAWQMNGRARALRRG